MKLLCACVLALAATAVTAGCASTGTASQTASRAASSKPTAPASPSCLSRVVAWRDGGGKSEVDAVVSDLGTIQKAGSALGGAMTVGSGLSGPESDLQSAAASLQSDAQAGEADPPPSCVNGMKANYMQAMTDFGKAAADYQNCVSELSSGSDSVALGDIQAGNAATNKGTKKVLAATGALQALEQGQS